ncbi:hypothetical protein VNI00_017935 [Paramarasmius palmivorus]|uniref:HNH nuclease domain-containing protein n=1 Tax=Paramarasmius palmivorus TaxID=297713 RepID=A0AAW0B261_9AGAR
MQRNLRKRQPKPAESPNLSQSDPNTSPLPPSDPGSTVDGTYNDEEERRGPLPKTPSKNRDPNKKSLTRAEQRRVVKASAYGKRCGVTGESFIGNSDNEFCHVAEKSTPIQLVHHLETKWALPHGTLNIDRSENILIMQANLHKAFDTAAFMFFPNHDVLARVEQYTDLPHPKLPFDTVFKFKPGHFWDYDFIPLTWNEHRSIFIKNINCSKKTNNEDKFDNAPGYTQFDPLDRDSEKRRIFRFHVNPFFMIYNAGLKISELEPGPFASLLIRDGRAKTVDRIYKKWTRDYLGPAPTTDKDEDEGGDEDSDEDDEGNNEDNGGEHRDEGIEDSEAASSNLSLGNDKGKAPQRGLALAGDDRDYGVLAPAGQVREDATSEFQEGGGSTIAGGPPASTFVGTDDSDSHASGSQWDDNIFAPSIASAPAGVPGPSFTLSGNIDKRLRGHPKAPKTNIQNTSPVPQAIRGLKRKQALAQSDAASEPQASTRGRPHRGAPKTFSLPPLDEPGQPSSQSAMPPPSIPSRRHSIRLRSSATQASASSSTIHNEGGPPQSVAASQSTTNAPAAKSTDDEDSRHSLSGPKRKKKKRNSSAEYKPGHS